MKKEDLGNRDSIFFFFHFTTLSSPRRSRKLGYEMYNRIMALCHFTRTHGQYWMHENGLEAISAPTLLQISSIPADPTFVVERQT